MTLKSDVIELASGPNFGALTTLMQDGTPMTHVMWVDCDDDNVLINTEVHRAKYRNLERDPRATITIWDAGSPYRYVEVRGRVVDQITGPEALKHIHSLSQKYMGQNYDESVIRSERVIVKIAPERQNVRG